ncbi:MAG: cysteine desulfurase [Cyclobacteriaceae bacterium]|nr:cysteine desulfurase [Cyclobacteriaceae bacterium]
MIVYLDNAATTPLDERVFEAMKPYLLQNHGNPSSIHQHGRMVRSAVERARKTVADILNVAPAEVFFTSGGTETNNTIIKNAIKSRGITHAITSKIEHHAVLHALEYLQKEGKIALHFVEMDGRGRLDLVSLQKLLQTHRPAFVSLMHANNEIGNYNDVQLIGELCRENQAFFHSDMVQSLGHTDIDLSKLNIHSIAGSAHKFHGPKGIGLMYINAEMRIPPLLIGGGQERNMRGGTENVAGIIGLAKALELAYAEKEANQNHLLQLKNYTIHKLSEKFSDICYNGLSADLENSLHKVLSLSIPGIDDNDMLLFNLDINGISVSGGSACASGTSIGSHVLDALHLPPNTGALRVSFSKFNTQEEIDYFIEKLAVAIL